MNRTAEFATFLRENGGRDLGDRLSVSTKRNTSSKQSEVG